MNTNKLRLILFLPRRRLTGGKTALECVFISAHTYTHTHDKKVLLNTNKTQTVSKLLEFGALPNALTGLDSLYAYVRIRVCARVCAYVNVNTRMFTCIRVCGETS